jgi:alpha-D-ribose 1-methylphosphonate 5-triphosphate diphosphatase PhnM
LTDKGHTVRLEIYRGPDTDWTLEAVDASGNSTVWDDEFPTDQAALDEALRTIRDEGIEVLVGAP